MYIPTYTEHIVIDNGLNSDYYSLNYNRNTYITN